MKLYCFYLKDGSTKEYPLYAFTMSIKTADEFKRTRKKNKFVYDEIVIPNDDMREFMSKNKIFELRHKKLDDMGTIVMTKSEYANIFPNSKHYMDEVL